MSPIKFMEKSDIEEWLITYMREELNIDENEIDFDAQFSDYGLDSSAAVILTGDLGEWLGYDPEPTLLLDYPTLSKLVDYLADSLKSNR